MSFKLLEISAKMREEASIFLAKKEIVKLLSSYGEVSFTGSYKTDLMVWPDIDIQVTLSETTHVIEVFTDLAKICLTDPDLHKLTMMNFTPEKKSNLPLGFYLGLDYKDSGIQWKLDIWALNKEDEKKDRLFTEKILSNMTPAIKELILKIKYNLMASGKRVPQFASYHLYSAIFDEKLTDEAEILTFIQSAIKDKT